MNLWTGLSEFLRTDQFVSLRGWPVRSPPPTLATVSGTIVHSDNTRIAALTFPSTKGGRLLAKINDAAVRSLLSNHHSVEEDCPTRERVSCQISLPSESHSSQDGSEYRC